MTTKYKEVEITVKRGQLEYQECDWCGKRSNGREFDDRDPTDDSKNLGPYSINEFELYWETGSQYPEGRHTERETADFCNECRQKLFNLLKDQGVKFRTEDTSW